MVGFFLPPFRKIKFGRGRKCPDFIFEVEKLTDGTGVFMEISPFSERTTKEVFNEFSEEEFGFGKTVVPVSLVKYHDENLVSRSQAKRMLNRLEKFKNVLFDFSGISTIGRAFADETFRVFANNHPDID